MSFRTNSPLLQSPTHQQEEQQPYRSTPDSRSSVLSRARQYTRKIEKKEERRKRSQSLDRNKVQQGSDFASPRSSLSSYRTTTTTSTRRQTTSPTSFDYPTRTNTRSHSVGRNNTSKSYRLTSTKDIAISNSIENEDSYYTMTTATTNSSSSPSPAKSQSTRPSSRPTTNNAYDVAQEDDFHQQPTQQQQHENHAGGGGGGGVVSPELLVDALSGHEDGLLAIAEKLMEHYDHGYDAMGEAIIDAFADVQKLFQHVVEAAHMEGAAFEASRREEEMKESKKQTRDLDILNNDNASSNNDAMSPAGPIRHDEFIDQDVKDCLTDAIRKGVTLKEQNKHDECYDLYEQACQQASSLLPVDSDHRGRLQLSIARAESMSPDRACAILRYAMDDVLRSGMRAGKIPLPDPSKRADVVLSKPKSHPSMNGGHSGVGNTVQQSSEEALNSLVEEMKEILDAPVYKDTPLQDVAKRFWTALQENQKLSSKNEERLEHNLGKLKGDFLLARAEWEEKLTQAQEHAEMYKLKYKTMKDGKETSLMEEARTAMSNNIAADLQEEKRDGLGSLGGNSAAASFRYTANRPEFQKGVESVTSMGSSLAQHAKTLVGSFACAGNNERTGQVLVSERATEEWRGRRSAAAARGVATATESAKEQLSRGLEMSNSNASTTRSYRESPQPPRHVDV